MAEKIIDLSELGVNDGFKISGAAPGDNAGISVASAGDINGDGMGDIIIGATMTDAAGRPDAGSAYVVYGIEGGHYSIDLATLVAEQGFAIRGAAPGDWAGHSVSSAGDVNGDGIDDIFVGASRSDDLGRPSSGAAYVVYGSDRGFSDVDLAGLNAQQGFKLVGAPNDFAGQSVASAGDVNGDGIDDLLVGAPSGNSAYVVYGSGGGPSTVDLPNMSPAQGFEILGLAGNDRIGGSVSSAGDVNGDGIDDIIVSAREHDPAGIPNAGAAYVIYGSEFDRFPVNVANLTPAQGFKISGSAMNDYAGSSVSSVGDVNGDGIDDILVSANSRDPAGRFDAGAAYVIYGAEQGLADINLAALTAEQGFEIAGAAPGDLTGTRVSSAGDVNGDGIDDILVGAPSRDGGGRPDAGAAFVVYGVEGGVARIDLANLTARQGFEIIGANTSDKAGQAVSAAGDVNGDGYDDILVGAPGEEFYRPGSPIGLDAGAAYVVYGFASSASPPVVEIGAPSATLVEDDILLATAAVSVSGNAAEVDAEAMAAAGWSETSEGVWQLLGVYGTATFEEATRGISFAVDAEATQALGDGESVTTTVSIAYANQVGGNQATVAFTIEGRDEIVDGTEEADLLAGTAYDDRISGLAGDDLLLGSAGADELLGGDGYDVASYAASAAGVTIDLGSGTAAGGVGGTGGDAEGDRLTSIEGLIGSDFADTLTGDNGASILDGAGGDDTLTGGQGADGLYGGEGADTLLGGNYADHLDGGLGADVMKGGAGNDTYVVDDAGDQVVEQANFGAHDLVEASASYTLGKFVEKLVLTGEAGIDGTGNGLANVVTGNTGDNVLSGLAGDDTLRGNAGADVLDGGTGADTMLGGAGDDTYVVDDAGDVVSESSGGTDAGSDTVVSTIAYGLGDFIENLTLAGSADIDGTGNAARNTLIGNDGANVLDGGLGSDVMTGGAGEDGFLFSTAPGSSNIDTITDFAVGEDTILLDAAVFAALGLGEVSADDFAYLSQASGDEHLIYNGNNGRLFYDADGAGGADKVAIATLDNLAAITHDDFFVV